AVAEAARDDEGAATTLGQRCKGGLDLAIVPRAQNEKVPANCAHRLLRRCDLRIGAVAVRVEEVTDSGGVRHNVQQHAHLLWAKLARHCSDARDVSPRPVETWNEPLPDWIAARAEYNGNRRRRRLCCWSHAAPGGDNDVHAT